MHFDLKLSHKGAILIFLPLMLELMLLALFLLCFNQPETFSTQFLNCFIIISAVSSTLVAILLNLWISQSTWSRLAKLIQNTRHLLKGEPLLDLDGTSDEIGQVDKSLHKISYVLKESLRKEQAILENTVDVICTLDEEGNFKNISPAALKMWGFTPHELQQRWFMELITPEDAADTLKAFKKVRYGKTQQPFESRVIRKDGSLMNILWSAHWSESEQSMFCVAHDITERKKLEDTLKVSQETLKLSEARTRLIVESMPVGLVITSEQGKIDLVNPQIEEMFGQQWENLVGKPVGALFLHEGRELDSVTFMQNIQEKAQGKVAEMKAQRKDGTVFPVELSFNKFHAPEGTSCLLNILDVSQRYELEKLKRQFVAMVSHDLRTPLTSIQGILALVSKEVFGKLSGDGKKMVAEAEGEVDRLIKLINDLLDLAKMEAGKLEVKLKNVSLTTILNQAQDSVRAFAVKHGIMLVVPKSELYVYGDPARLVQVVINLLDNAIKFSDPGSPVVVTVEKLQNMAEVRVTDLGKGIPDNYKESIFEQFHQIAGSSAEHKQGTGLGLAICKTVIEQHGGTIGVESTLGKGSIFWFRIPLGQGP